MRRAVLGLCSACSLMLASPALAWEVTVSQDPMDDSAIAFTAEMNQSQTWALTIKCWNGKPDATLLGIMTVLPWSEDAAAAVDVKIRVDKNEPLELAMLSQNLGNRLAEMASVETQPQVMDILKQMSQAKGKIAVAFGSTVETVSTKGLSAAMKKMADACAMTLTSAQ